MISMYFHHLSLTASVPVTQDHPDHFPSPATRHAPQRPGHPECHAYFPGPFSATCTVPQSTKLQEPKYKHLECSTASKTMKVRKNQNLKAFTNQTVDTHSAKYREDAQY